MPESTPRKHGSAVRLLILLLVLILLAGGAVGIYLLSSEKPFATYGDTDSANVRELQHWLAQLGYYDGSVTGNFDDATESAYREYCLEHGRTSANHPDARTNTSVLTVYKEDYLALATCSPIVTATPSPTSTAHPSPTPTATPILTPTAVPEPRALWIPVGSYKITTYNKNTCIILKYTGSSITLTIPDKIDNHIVTAIEEYAFYGCDSLATVIIPNHVQTIRRWAFAFCDSLTTVTIPESARFIESIAFNNCPNLTLCVPAGSYAEQYAIENRIPYATY